MTNEIAPPRRAANNADRDLDCQFALEPAFQMLASRAQAVGWSEDEVAAALLELAHHHLQGIIADRKTRLDIEAAARSVM